MRAELACIDDPGERRRFAVSCAMTSVRSGCGRGPMLVAAASFLTFGVTTLVASRAMLAGDRTGLVSTTPEGSLLPQVAASGLMLVSVALLMGSALTTEFVFGVKEPDLLVPETAACATHASVVPAVTALESTERRSAAVRCRQSPGRPASR